MSDYCLHCCLKRGRPEGCNECGPGAMGKKVESHPGWLTPGVILNDTYLIGRPLGHGGFGITYLGVDLKLDIRVAIKEYLPRDLATRNPNGQTVEAFPDSREIFQHGRSRFMDEARVLARFGEHPNIVSVLAFFEANESAYFVMRYLEGQDLAALLKSKGGCLPAEHAVEITLSVLKGLQAVHKAGLLHRDIKPQNIYISQNGDVKLLDFGAARYALLENSRTLTTILTPGYAAPEMYDPKDRVGAYTDVYSVGATLHEMLTGESPKDIFNRVGDDSLLPPATIDPSIDVELSDIVYKALSMKSSGRFQDADSFINALNGLTLSKSPRRRRSSTKTQWLISDSDQDIVSEPKNQNSGRSHSNGTSGAEIPLTSNNEEIQQRRIVSHHPAFHPTVPAPEHQGQVRAQASLIHGHTHKAEELNNLGQPGSLGHISPGHVSPQQAPAPKPISFPSYSNKSHDAPITGPGPDRIHKDDKDPEAAVTGPAVVRSVPNNHPVSSPHGQPVEDKKQSSRQSGGHPLLWILRAVVIIAVTAIVSAFTYRWLTHDDQRSRGQEKVTHENTTSKKIDEKVEKKKSVYQEADDSTVVIDGVRIKKAIAETPQCLRYMRLFLCFMKESVESSGGDFSNYLPIYVSTINKSLAVVAAPQTEKIVREASCRQMIKSTWMGIEDSSVKKACRKHIKKSDLEGNLKTDL